MVTYVINWAFLLPLVSRYYKLVSFILTTLLAINMASSAIIAGKISDLTAEADFKFSKTETHLENSVVLQLVLIGIAFFVGVFRSSEAVKLMCRP